MPENPAGQQWPDVLAMVLADTVLQEPTTGKFYIQGTYSVIGAAHFPWVHPILTVYFAVTNGHGKTPIKIRLIDVDGASAPIFELDAVLDLVDPLAVIESVASVRAVT